MRIASGWAHRTAPPPSKDLRNTLKGRCLRRVSRNNNPLFKGDDTAEDMTLALRSSLESLLIDSYGLSPSEFDANTPLFTSGLLDSFVLVELISFIENAQQVQIKPSAVHLENFDTINRIIALVERLKPADASS